MGQSTKKESGKPPGRDGYGVYLDPSANPQRRDAECRGGPLGEGLWNLLLALSGSYGVAWGTGFSFQ